MCRQLLKSIPARAWFASFALSAFALVAIGLQIQAIHSLAPCPLCIFQRVLYLLIGGLALIAWLAPSWQRLWAALMGVTALVGLMVASYQSWMQAYPHLATECSYTDPNLIERFVDWLGMLHPGLFLATGFCAGRDWLFLNLSMANWSVVVFAAYLLAAVLVLRCRK